MKSSENNKPLIGDTYGEIFQKYMQEYTDYLDLKGIDRKENTKEESSIKKSFESDPVTYGVANRNQRTDQQWSNRIQYLQHKRKLLNSEILREANYNPEILSNKETNKNSNKKEYELEEQSSFEHSNQKLGGRMMDASYNVSGVATYEESGPIEIETFPERKRVHFAGDEVLKKQGQSLIALREGSVDNSTALAKSTKGLSIDSTKKSQVELLEKRNEVTGKRART